MLCHIALKLQKFLELQGRRVRFLTDVSFMLMVSAVLYYFADIVIDVQWQCLYFVDMAGTSGDRPPHPAVSSALPRSLNRAAAGGQPVTSSAGIIEIMPGYDVNVLILQSSIPT